MNVSNKLDDVYTLDIERLVSVILSLIENKGNKVLDDESTFFALLNDLYPDHNREIFLQKCLFQKASILDLMNLWSSDLSAFEIQSSILKKDLKDSFFLDTEAIDWIVCVWVEVFSLLKNGKNKEPNNEAEKNDNDTTLSAELNTLLQPYIIKYEALLIEKNKLIDDLKEEKIILTSRANNKELENKKLQKDLEKEKRKVVNLNAGINELDVRLSNTKVVLGIVIFSALLVVIVLLAIFSS